MDFFKFESATDATTLDQGEHINGIDKSLWVERYFSPGEFSFEAKLSSGLMEFLPLDTLISHADTLDIMIVESHEINEDEEQDSTIKITGRSFLSALENRIVGVNQARASSTISPYVLSAGYTWNQIVTLINDHIGNVTNVNDNLTQVVASASVPGTGVSVDRPVDFGTVLKAVLDILKVDDLGIKTIRKNTFDLGVSGNTAFVVHGGVDHSSDVFFSWQGGDVSGMNYLFTNKTLKNSAFVLGRYVQTMVDMGPTKYERRIMLVDGSDIDGSLENSPTGSLLTTVLAKMVTLGQQALMGQNQITMNQTDVSKNAPYQYREHYDIGDLISVGGNFGQIAVMRVVEFAEVEDENGESSHPTLAIIGA